jgi:hypothetical protein
VSRALERLVCVCMHTYRSGCAECCRLLAHVIAKSCGLPQGSKVALAELDSTFHSPVASVQLLAARYSCVRTRTSRVVCRLWKSTVKLKLALTRSATGAGRTSRSTHRRPLHAQLAAARDRLI